jgi:hypothetical protein
VIPVIGWAPDPDDRAGATDVPWYAWPVPPGERNPALRPVREGEVEELDEEPGPADDVLGLAPPADLRRMNGPAEGAAFVALELGRALKSRRWALHLGQRAFARRLGWAQGRVSKLERGRQSLTVEDVIQLALETRSVVRLHVVPDGAVDDGYHERTSVTPVGDAGSVRLAVGRGRGPIS